MRHGRCQLGTSRWRQMVPWMCLELRRPPAAEVFPGFQVNMSPAENQNIQELKVNKKKIIHDYTTFDPDCARLWPAPPLCELLPGILILVEVIRLGLSKVSVGVTEDDRVQGWALFMGSWEGERIHSTDLSAFYGFLFTSCNQQATKLVSIEFWSPIHHNWSNTTGPPIGLWQDFSNTKEALSTYFSARCWNIRCSANPTVVLEHP